MVKFFWITVMDNVIFAHARNSDANRLLRKITLQEAERI